MSTRPGCLPCFTVTICLVWSQLASSLDLPWPRFAVDEALRGADGVRLADVNGDGLPDIATGWEESGTTKIYLHPGYPHVTQAWPGVVVGQAPGVEDAVWADLNANGRLDVLSSCEGNEQSLRAHLAPAEPDDLLKPAAWTTQVLAISQSKTRWMYALPMDKQRIVVGSKSPAGMVGLLEAAGENPTLEFKLRKLSDAGWIMSLELLDVDRDGDDDVVYSDRKGATSGVFWLENPGPNHHAAWRRHPIGAIGQEVMFLQIVRDPSLAQAVAAERSAAGKSSGISATDPHLILVAAKPHEVFWLFEGADCRQPWEEELLSIKPSERIGDAKSVALGDLNGDGLGEIVFSCENAKGNKSGVVYLARSETNSTWLIHDVSGPEGIKYDRIELVDLDGDRDLDILTCEERADGRGLGVIWYANPTR